MENLISQVNELQDKLSSADIKNIIQLPEIVVVGEQSSGKSSVLQSLIEQEILPKGRGIVTRCPIRIRMNRSKEGIEYATFAHLPNQTFTFGDVVHEISKIFSL